MATNKSLQHGCKTIEMPTVGHTNGIENLLKNTGFSVDYDKDRDVLVVEYDD